jgi:hypothetical protein
LGAEVTGVADTAEGLRHGPAGAAASGDYAVADRWGASDPALRAAGACAWRGRHEILPDADDPDEDFARDAELIAGVLELRRQLGVVGGRGEGRERERLRREFAELRSLIHADVESFDRDLRVSRPIVSSKTGDLIVERVPLSSRTAGRVRAVRRDLGSYSRRHRGSTGLVVTGGDGRTGTSVPAMTAPIAWGVPEMCHMG